MVSNYPPGVSGQEFEIAGPEAEWEEQSECPHCEHTENNIHQSHVLKGIWFECSHCGAIVDLGYPEDQEDYGPDPDDWRDRQRDLEDDARYGIG